MDYNSIPKIDAHKEKLLWDSAIFVFDTSAICALYDLTLHHRQVVITILRYLSDRIWMPHQVLSEYRANRQRAICNPINEKYFKPKILDNKFIDDVNKQIEEWSKNKYLHPYVEDDQLKLIIDEVEQAKKHIRNIKNVVKEQYDKRTKEIKDILYNDELKDFINTIHVGSELSFEQIKEIVIEGDYRYRHQIPPGYKDDNVKEGIRKFGDLIIWKEIIKYATITDNNVIFICNDFKEDWYMPKNVPRIELISEFQENTNKNIWFYTIEGFISKLQEYYKSPSPMLPLYDKLEEVSFVLHRIFEEKKRGGVAMKLRCNKCHKEIIVWKDELDLEWDSNGSYDRGMGEEIEWFATIYTNCSHCKQQIEILFFVYEYPIGVYNTGDVTCDGAEILSNFDIEEYSPIYNYDDEQDE